MEGKGGRKIRLRASRPIFSGVSGGTNRDERSVTKPISDPVPCRRRNGRCPTTFSAFPLSVSHRPSIAHPPVRIPAKRSNYYVPVRVKTVCTKLYIGNYRRVDEEKKRLSPYRIPIEYFGNDVGEVKDERIGLFTYVRARFESGTNRILVTILEQFISFTDSFIRRSTYVK